MAPRLHPAPKRARPGPALAAILLSGCFNPTGSATGTTPGSTGSTTGATAEPTTASATTTAATTSTSTAPDPTTATTVPAPDQAVPVRPCRHIDLVDLENGEGGFVILPGPTAAGVGVGVTGIGDFNGDTLADIRVAALPATEPTCTSFLNWQTWLVYGKEDGAPVQLSRTLEDPFFTADHGLYIDGEDCGLPQPCPSNFGTSFAPLGDVNGDTRADVAVGAFRANNNYGRVYVLHGRSGVDILSVTLNLLPDDYVLEGMSSQLAGIAVAGVGDLNNDGVPDLGFHAGASIYQPLILPRSIYIRYGGKPTKTPFSLSGFLTPEDGFRIHDPDPPNYRDFRANLRGNADFNGDGQVDLLLDTQPADDTRIVVVFGTGNPEQPTASLDDIIITEQRTTIIQCSPSCGSSARFLGDINGDGFDDIAAGEWEHDGSTGRVAVVFGAPGARTIDINALDGTDGFVIHGESGADFFGFAVNGADLDGDGSRDLIIGAPGYDDNRGRVYVVFGRPDLTAVNLTDILAGEGGFVIDAIPGLADNLGFSLDNAGHLNSDELDDIVLGAPGITPGACTMGSPTGRAYVLFGGSCSR